MVAHGRGWAGEACQELDGLADGLGPADEELGPGEDEVVGVFAHLLDVEFRAVDELSDDLHAAGHVVARGERGLLHAETAQGFELALELWVGGDGQELRDGEVVMQRDLWERAGAVAERKQELVGERVWRARVGGRRQVAGLEVGVFFGCEKGERLGGREVGWGRGLMRWAIRGRAEGCSREE